MGKPAWDHAPPFGRPVDAICKVLPGNKQEYRILSRHLCGIWTHYIGPSRRSFPCTGEQGVCFFDHRYTSRRWHGWVAVQKPFERIVRFLSLTHSAVRDNPRLTQPNIILRGYQLWVGRGGPDMQSKMYALLGFPSEDKRVLLAEPNVRGFLINMFGPPFSWPCTRAGMSPPELDINADWWTQDMPAEVEYDDEPKPA